MAATEIRTFLIILVFLLLRISGGYAAASAVIVRPGSKK